MCEYCEKPVYEKNFEYEDPKGTYKRKWYKEIHIVDEMDKNRVSYYGIFSRFHVPDIAPNFDGFYLNSSGNMLVKIMYCPWCGRKLMED